MQVPTVEVVVPIHNAPDLTRRCVESVFAAVGSRVTAVHLCDDASDEETARMLDGLRFPRVEVHHGLENVGFGRTVNGGIAGTRSEFVLVLNSDVHAHDDFLKPMIDALIGDPRLAAVSPVAHASARADLSRFRACRDVVPTYTLRGFAFLVRRSAFDEVGGFDPIFQRGYYEDTDLSRRFIENHWRLGVVPAAELGHDGHGSFKAVAGVAELRDRNRRIYLARHPGARQRILLVSGDLRGQNDSVREAARNRVSTGATLEWHSATPLGDLPAIEIRVGHHSPLRTLRRLVRKRGRDPRRFTELWLAGRLGRDAAVLERTARLLGIGVRHLSKRAPLVA